MTPEKQQMIDWLRAKGACQEGREWAERECNSLAEVWAKAKPEWLIWVACRALDKRKIVSSGAACAERVRHLMDDQRSRDALDVAHRYGRGDATDEELAAAAAAAAAAWRSAVAAPVSPVAYAAAAASAAFGPANVAPVFSGAYVAYVAYAAAVASAAFVAAEEREWQAEHLRANFSPDWSL